MRDKRINALVLIINVSRKSINAQQSPSFYNPPQVHSKSETNQKSSPERNELIHVNNVDFAGYVESLLKNDADSEEQHFYDLSPLDDGKVSSSVCHLCGSNLYFALCCVLLSVMTFLTTFLWIHFVITSFFDLDRNGT